MTQSESLKLQAKLDSPDENIEGRSGSMTDTQAGKLNEWLKDD